MGKSGQNVTKITTVCHAFHQLISMHYIFVNILFFLALTDLHKKNLVIMKYFHAQSTIKYMITEA